MNRNLDKKCCSRIPSLERRFHWIVKYVMTPQPQFTSGVFFISLQRDRRVTAPRTNNYKARFHAHFFQAASQKKCKLKSHPGKEARKRNKREENEPQRAEDDNKREIC
jgi:hypothetical protein